LTLDKNDFIEGITLLSWIAIRTGLAEMPGDFHFKQLVSASFLGGIGFTLSLFIANATFADSGMLAGVKLSILVASVLAGVLGTVALGLFSRVPSETTKLEPAPAAD
jgi:Na+:H+ antiporter, NhaA family